MSPPNSPHNLLNVFPLFLAMGRIIKRTLLLLLPLALVVGWFSIAPQERDQLVWNTKRHIADLRYGRELRYEQLSVLRPEDVEVKLPIDRDNVWWRANRKVIEAELSTHPLIQRASVAPCEWYSITCYSITLTERVPQYVVKIGAERWLLGEDGGFISTIPADGALPENGVLVAGVGDTQGSPDLVRAQLKNMKGTLPIVQREAQLQASSVQFINRNEVRLTFRGQPFRAVFDLSHPSVSVQQQAQRLRAILKHMQGRLDQLGEVDLSFNRLAVVSGVGLREPPADPAQSEGAHRELAASKPTSTIKGSSGRLVSR